MLLRVTEPPPCNSMYYLTLGTIAIQGIPSSSLFFTNKAQPCSFNPIGFQIKSGVFLSSFQKFQKPCAVYGNGWKNRGQGGVGLVEMDNFDDSYYDIVEEDDEDLLIPFEDTKTWLKNKPKGFGVGKVYDTKIEDKLLEEMELSRKAQAANVNKLKNNPLPLHPGSTKDGQRKRAEIDVPSGGRVRLVNLPKKKNIHRDLKSAFQGTPGIIDIIPAVSGNKKTRDPVCKGFGFVNFNSKVDALRFVELYSGQTITFGKIQKQIRCEMINPQSPSSAQQKLAENADADAHLFVPDKPSVDGEVTSGDLNGSAKEFFRMELEDITGNMGTGYALELDDSSEEPEFISDTSVLPSELLKRDCKSENKSPSKVKLETVVKKRQPAKGKVKANVPKLEIPGSAKRLKIKEKAKLVNVFSKYGLKDSFASEGN